MANHENVVVVSIKKGERVENPRWNTWRLTVRRLEIVAGSHSLQEYSFSTTQSSKGCGIDSPPREGEKWVVYHDRSDPSLVLSAFPLRLARQHDPRLAQVR
jgi:hypothetical protein